MTIQALQASPSFGQDDQQVQKKSLAAPIGAAVVTTLAGAAIPQFIKPSEDKFEKSTDVAKTVYEESLKKVNDEIDTALKANEGSINEITQEAVDAKRTALNAESALEKDHAVMDYVDNGKNRVKTEAEFNKAKEAGGALEKETRSYDEMKKAYESFDAKQADVVAAEAKLKAKTSLETAKKAVEESNAAVKAVEFVKDDKGVIDATKTKVNGKLSTEAFTEITEGPLKGKKFGEIVKSAENLKANETALNGLRSQGLSGDALKAFQANEAKAKTLAEKVELLTAKEGKTVTMLDDLKAVFKDIKAGKSIEEAKNQEKEIVEGIMKKIKNKNSMIYGAVGLAVGAVIIAAAALSGKKEAAAE